MVLRAFPIRVAGDSGPFGAPEIDWGTIAAEGGHGEALSEFTSVTGRLRRVARFDPLLAREAIRANQPTVVVLNHVDYIDAAARGALSDSASAFVAQIASEIGRVPDYVGLGPDTIIDFKLARAPAVAI